MPDPEKQDRGRPTHPRSNSWDILGHRRDRSESAQPDGTRTPRRVPARTPEWEGFEFNTAMSSVEQLRFAEGDVGKSKVRGFQTCPRAGSFTQETPRTHCPCLRHEKTNKQTARQILLLPLVKVHLHQMVHVHLPGPGREYPGLGLHSHVMVVRRAHADHQRNAHPRLQLLWIPGIVWLAGVRHAAVWNVPLVSIPTRRRLRGTSVDPHDNHSSTGRSGSPSSGAAGGPHSRSP
jgi:hypothetical protein